MDIPALRKLLAALVLPPLGPLLIAFAGLIAWPRHPRIGRVLAWTGVLGLTILSLPLTSHLLTSALWDSGMFDAQAARSAGAIVILGGGVRRGAVEYGGDTVGRLTLDRVRYGARVARETGLPVLVTGGTMEPGERTEAEIMKAVLESEFSVPVRWTEDQSRNTRQNAQFSARLLGESRIRKVVLVAHEFDMRRAQAEFEAAGIEVVPAPTLLMRKGPLRLTDLVPNIRAAERNYFALYEMLALAVRVLGL
jgi:uncharacterized SAM-binding protein YcdF (DUF218 family)